VCAKPVAIICVIAVLAAIGLLRATQDGFADPDDLLKQGHHGAVVLSNNAAQCDLSRLAALAARKSSGAVGVDNEALSCLLVSKVYLGVSGPRGGGNQPVSKARFSGFHSVHDEVNDILSIPLPRSRSDSGSGKTDAKGSISSGYPTLRGGSNGQKTKKKSGDRRNSVDSNKGSEKKGSATPPGEDEVREAPEPTRLCYVFEPLSVLPEYIISFDYLWRDPLPEGAPAEPITVIPPQLVDQEKAAKSFVGLRGPLSQFLSSDIVAAQDSHIEAFVDQVEH
jgi:hypothetical protein